ncbi:MAG: hypothetical protein ACR2NA_08015, partial [Solirubrobacterales bacterium]
GERRREEGEGRGKRSKRQGGGGSRRRAGSAALVLSVAFELLRYGNSEPHDRVRSDERARSHDRAPYDDPTRRL